MCRLSPRACIFALPFGFSLPRCSISPLRYGLKPGSHGVLSVTFIAGLVLLAIAVGMFLFGRTRSGDMHPVRLMNVWALGQLYVLAVLVTLVMGCAFVISDLPL
jgi:hypothetical protein